jgi:hypothetical protein
MAGNLLGEPFRDYVNEQIKVRQEVHGKKNNRTTQDIQYLNSRNAWIKLASGVSIEEKRLDLLKRQNDRGNPLLNNIRTGQDLAIQYVLFNGLTRFGSSKIEVSSGNLTEEQAAAEDYEKYLPSKTINTFKQIQRAGVGGSNGAYGVGGTDFGYSPMPGIIDMDHKCLNRGSIKKTTLNIKAHNKNQFDILDVLYLRLGYSVFLEWGYDKYLDNDGNLKQMGDTLIDGPFWEDKFQKSDYSKWLPIIEEKRRDTNGNYEGAFGVITNFSWTFEDDGTYNIKLEIINLGDVIESLKVNLPSIVPDNIDPYLASRYTSLVENVGEGNASESDFYNVIYPGLKESIEDWFDRSIKGESGTPVKTFKRGTQGGVFRIYDYSQIMYGTVDGKNFDVEDIGEEANQITADGQKVKEFWIHPSFKQAVFDIPNDNTFLGDDGGLYTNPNATSLTEGGELGNFEVKQEDIRNGVRWALANWYYLRRWVRYKPDPDRSGIKVAYASALTNTSGYLSAFDKLSKQIKSPEIRVELIDERKNAKGPYRYFGQIPYPETGADGSVTTKYKEYSVRPSIKGSQANILQSATKISSTGIEWWNDWARIYSDIKGKGDQWNYLLKNTVPSSNSTTGNEFNYGPGKAYIASKVYEWFKIQDKAKVIPLGKAALELRQKGSNLAETDPQRKQELEQTVDQNIKDLQNRNKNRIFRFFYDVRNSPTTIIKNDIFVAHDKVIGKVKYGTELIQQFNPSVDLSKEAVDKGTRIPEKEIIKLNNETFGKFRSSPVIHLEKLLPVNNQWFIRLGVFLNYLQNSVIPRIDTGEPMIKIDTDEKKNICYAIDNVYSLDMRKCIAYNRFFIIGVDERGKEVKEGNFAGIRPFVTYAGTGDNKLHYGQIMNIYFSFNRLEEIFSTTDTKNEVSLYKALKSICTDINECFGNINNIEPIVDENNIVKFIDQSNIPGIEEIAKKLRISFPPPKEEAVLEIFGYNQNNTKSTTSNFIRKVGLTTEISKNYATIITIGATANGSVPGMEATAFSRWNIGIKDRFKNNILDSHETDKNPPISPISSSAATRVRESYVAIVQNDQKLAKLGLDEGKGDMFLINEDLIDYNQGVVEDFYKLEQAENSFERDENGNPINSVESSVGFLPFNLKLDMDGIGGIKIYNKVTINTSFLPSNYPETLKFIITGVNHKLSDNDWVTSLETIATSTNKQTNK